MSYREIRSFVESMRALGYPRLISMESFRTPNFRLVADILFWLTLRYDSSAEIPDDIDTDDARVEFLKAVAQTIYSKARIKLNIKQLYRADGYAVKELLKLSSMLYDAMRAGDNQEGENANTANAKSEAGDKGLSATDIAKKLEELRGAREVAKEIVDCGERLVACLMKEESIRPARDQALQLLGQLGEGVGANGAGSAEVAALVRTELAGKLDLLKQKVAEEQRRVDSLSKEEQLLQQKVATRDAEYERLYKRASDMHRIRPAYMDEYEHVERELKIAYEVYVEKFRNLQHLERALSEINEQEANLRKEANKQLRKMQKKIRADELQLLRGESAGRGAMEAMDDDEDDDLNIRDDDGEDDGLDGLDMDTQPMPEEGSYGVPLRGAIGANRFSQPTFFSSISHGSNPDAQSQSQENAASRGQQSPQGSQQAPVRPSDSARKARPNNALAPLAAEQSSFPGRRMIGSMVPSDEEEEDDDDNIGGGIGQAPDRYQRPMDAMGARPSAARGNFGSSGRLGSGSRFGDDDDDDDDAPAYSGF